MNIKKSIFFIFVVAVFTVAGCKKSSDNNANTSAVNTTPTNTDTATDTDLDYDPDVLNRYSEDPRVCNEDFTGIENGTDPNIALKWKFLTGGDLYYAPITLGDKVFVFAQDNNIYAIDKTTGNLSWKYQGIEKLNGESLQVYADANNSNGKVYIGTKKTGKFYALNANTGELLWTKSFGIPEVHMPFVYNGDLYISTSHSARDMTNLAVLFVINAETGADKWKFTTDNYNLQTPWVETDTIYLGGLWNGPKVDEGGNLRIYSLDKASCEAGSCTVKWKHISQGGYPKRLYAAGGFMEYLPYRDYLMGVNIANGATGWNVDTENWVTDYGYDGEELFFGSATTNIFNIDAKTGAVKWKFHVGCKPMNYVAKNPVVQGDKIYFYAIITKGMGVLDRATGKLIWASPLGIDTNGPPVFDGEMFFISAADKTVYAYDLK